VPCTTGPLNHLLADRTYQPPKRMDRHESWWAGTARSREKANIIREADVTDAIVQNICAITTIKSMNSAQRVRALLLDFNGTVSDDEPLLCQILQELFAQAGKPLSEEEYYAKLAGRSDREIVRMWLGRDDPGLLQRKSARYRELADGSTVSDEARAAVRAAAEVVPVAIVSGAGRAEIDPVVEGAGLADAIALIVSEDDIQRSKPDPEGYLLALHLLGIRAADGAAVEDSEPGVEAAKAAGLYCAAITTTFPGERLRQADELAERFDRDLITRLVSPS
jgi:beta-phosphoglucomutase